LAYIATLGVDRILTVVEGKGIVGEQGIVVVGGGKERREIHAPD
jgi:hypothetical protein